jgi:ABC-type antimicrobial peptide transport system permease subunit
VISYDVAQRTGEIGVRMALGARKVDVLRLILTHGLALTLGGLVMGVVGALLLTRFLSARLFEVKPADLPTYIVASLLLMAVAIAACLIPARRATKVDPLVALRYE